MQVSKNRVDALLEEGRTDEALAIAEEVFKANPDMQDAWSLKADALARSGNHAEAATFLRDLKSRSGSGEFAYQQALAYAVYESEGRDASEPHFRELLDPRYPAEVRKDAEERLRDFEVERLYEQGIALLKKGEPDDALAIGDRLMKLEPAPNEAFELGALALQAKRRYAEAIELLEAYRKARFAGKAFPMQVDLAECYSGSGQFLRAREAYGKVFETPNTEEVDQEAARIAKEALRELMPITNAYIAGYSEYFTEEEGDMYRGSLEGRTGLIGPHQFQDPGASRRDRTGGEHSSPGELRALGCHGNLSAATGQRVLWRGVRRRERRGVLVRGGCGQDQFSMEDWAGD